MVKLKIIHIIVKIESIALLPSLSFDHLMGRALCNINTHYGCVTCTKCNMTNISDRKGYEISNNYYYY